ncbi:SPASM domain-containing protein [Thermococcus indicus]|uniref:SPASM domain-containing protein n=2 Tax=Thermococcus indicus TaxID=2586643 RepID=A0A4Y5SI64_9EURY|nr:SPASM domain-containing protein [Thermococcus indicus]
MCMGGDGFVSSLYLDKVLDEYILFSPKTLHLIRLDAESYELLDSIRKRGVEEGVSEFLKKHPEISPQDVDRVIEGLKALSAVPPYLSVDSKSSEVVPTSVALYLTSACNFKCVYCYEQQHGIPLFMIRDENDADGIIEFLLSRGSSKLSVGFFGGEPLLNFRMLRYIAETLSRRAASRGKTVNFSITTNGYLITPSVVDFFKRFRFNVVLSMDGPREIQNHNRPTKTGDPTFDVVMKNLRLLLTSGVPVTVRATILPEQIDRYFEIFRFFVENGVRSVHIEPASIGSDSFREIVSPLKEQLKLIAEYELEHIEETEMFRYSHFRKYFTILASRRSLVYPCGAGRKLFGVSSDGKLYPCQRFVGMDEFVVGDVRSGVNVDSEVIQKILRNPPREPCNHCWAYPLCRGGCYYINYMYSGDIHKPDPYYCEFIRELIRLSMWLYVKVKRNHPVIFEKMLKSLDYYSPPSGVSEASADESKIKKEVGEVWSSRS